MAPWRWNAMGCRARLGTLRRVCAWLASTEGGEPWYVSRRLNFCLSSREAEAQRVLSTKTCLSARSPCDRPTKCLVYCSWLLLKISIKVKNYQGGTFAVDACAGRTHGLQLRRMGG